jgi:hypothetical protein
MNTRFTTSINDESFEVEVEEGGELTFPGYDWEQDDLMAFMTGQKSNAKLLIERWYYFDPKHFKAAQILADNGVVNLRYFAYLVLDLAEHTLFGFEELYPDHKEPRVALARARRFLGSGKKRLNKLTEMAIKDCESIADHVKDEYIRSNRLVIRQGRNRRIKPREEVERRRLKNAHESVNAAVLALDATRQYLMDSVNGVMEYVNWTSGAARDIRSNAKKLEVAAADISFVTESHSNWSDFFDIESELQKEHDWQMRRLGYTLARFQAGKPWPAMSETP